MKRINCTLIGDGSSDKVLQYPIKWLLNEKLPDYAITLNFADLRPILRGGETLSVKLCKAIDLFPCDLLFIHRDAENKTLEARKEEINTAIEDAICQLPRCISVIPIRMSESWFLIDEDSIRQAAGNPNGRTSINLPALNTLERITDPKKNLIQLIEIASELNKRRRKGFNPHRAIHRVAEIITDFSPLRNLQSFQKLEEELEEIIETL